MNLGPIGGYPQTLLSPFRERCSPEIWVKGAVFRMRLASIQRRKEQGRLLFPRKKKEVVSHLQQFEARYLSFVAAPRHRCIIHSSEGVIYFITFEKHTSQSCNFSSAKEPRKCLQ